MVLFGGVSLVSFGCGMRGLNAFPYEYYARPKSRVSRRERHEYTVWTSIFETRAIEWSVRSMDFC